MIGKSVFERGDHISICGLYTIYRHHGIVSETDNQGSIIKVIYYQCLSVINPHLLCKK